MDPHFFDRLNALQNYQNQHANQANLEQLEANRSELAALRRQLAEEANKPQCPHCGGPSEQGFDRCKNCGQEIIWYGHFVGKPGQEQHLAVAMQQYQIAEQEKQRQRAENQKWQEQRRIERNKSKSWNSLLTLLFWYVGVPLLIGVILLILKLVEGF